MYWEANSKNNNDAYWENRLVIIEHRKKYCLRKDETMQKFKCICLRYIYGWLGETVRALGNIITDVTLQQLLIHYVLHIKDIDDGNVVINLYQKCWYCWLEYKIITPYWFIQQTVKCIVRLYIYVIRLFTTMVEKMTV